MKINKVEHIILNKKEVNHSFFETDHFYNTKKQSFSTSLNVDQDNNSSSISETSDNVSSSISESSQNHQTSVPQQPNNQYKQQTIKQDWINIAMQQRQKEFTEYTSLNLFVGTWNVNGRQSIQDIDTWIFPKDADIIVVGFQEIDLSKEAFLINDSLKEQNWNSKIKNSLGDNYQKITSKQLVGLLIFLYAKNTYANLIHCVQMESVGCGIMGLMGNKGAVCIRLKINDSILCFVNSHLAANTNMIDRRNQDYSEICRRISFPQINNNLSTYSKNQLNTDNYRCSVFDCDHLFWFGDLNYRINLDTDIVKKNIDKNNIDYLLENDQLIIEKANKRAFEGFCEGKITFKPTYKFDIGTDVYDTSDKQRCPSWCDRILWYSLNQQNLVKLEEYNSITELNSSDHKPIYARFNVDIKTFQKDKYATVYTKVVRELDKAENEAMPDAKISQCSIDFNTITFNQRKCRELSITNIGKVYLQFEFVKKLNQDKICKNWISIEPVTGMILPGNTMKIKVFAQIDNKTSENLNLKLENAEDILVLHLVNGKDYFITISANYIPTVFGIGLESLTRMPKTSIVSTHPVHMLPLENVHSVPRALWRIVDYIYKNGMDAPNLFLDSGNPSTINYIKECLDNDIDFDPLKMKNNTEQDYQDVYAMCETLIHFLDALPTPLIPDELYYPCLEASKFGREKIIDSLESLSRAHINTFLYLTAFIREIIGYQNTDKIALEKIALIISSVILRDPIPINNTVDDVVEKKKMVVLAFITTNEN